MANLVQTIRGIILENQSYMRRGDYWPRLMQVERIKGKATVITGIRRCGKSVYEKLYMHSLLEDGISEENICELDFSDDRLLDLRIEEPDLVAEAYYGIFPEKADEKVWFFFDEIQYLNHWELFVNRLQNTRDCEVNITGSSAKLLVREIATELGGRSLPWELFPFSFEEFLETKEDAAKYRRAGHISPDAARMCRKYFEEYCRTGGFPESIMMTEHGTRVRYLQNLAETVVFRDVVARYGLNNPNAVYRQMQMLLGCMSSLISYTKLKKRLAAEQYRVSVEMVKQVTNYFEDAYMIFSVEVLSLNTAVRNTNPRKIYCVDHRLAMSVSGVLTEDIGKILENLVFVHLRRRTDLIFYAKTPEGYEVDFAVLPRGEQITEECRPELIQVCADLSEPETMEREIRALRSGMRQYKKDTGTIVTLDTEDEWNCDEGIIKAVPAWKYLLSN